MWFANCLIVENSIVLPGSFYFGFIYGELCTLLCIWSDTIIITTSNNQLNEFEIIREVKCFTNILKKCRHTFAHFLFWIAFCNVVLLITIGYFTMSIVFDAQQSMGGMDLAKTYFHIGSSGCFIFESALLFMLCNFSENVAHSVQKLKEYILEIHSKNDYGLQKDGGELVLYHLLNEFYGFEAYGFFTLNHSLLTGIVSNFVTYLVVIINFRVSEGWIGKKNLIQFFPLLVCIFLYNVEKKSYSFFTMEQSPQIKFPHLCKE